MEFRCKIILYTFNKAILINNVSRETYQGGLTTMAVNDKEGGAINPDANKYDNEEAVKVPHVDIKVLNVPCTFQGGVQSPVNFYIGDPKPEQNPIHNQATWLSSSRGGTPPPEIMESLGTLQQIAIKNRVPLGDLCEYAVNSVSPKIDQTDPKEEARKKAEAEAKAAAASQEVGI